MDITSLSAGLITGIAVAYIIFYLFNKTKNVSKTEFDELSSKYNDTVANLRLFEDKSKALQTANDACLNKISSKENEVMQLQIKATSLETHLNNSETKIGELSQRLISELETNKSRQNEINLHKQKISELTATNNSVAESLSKQIETNTKQVKQIEELTSKLTELTSQVSKLTANNTALSEKLTTQKTEVEELQKTAHLQFEKIASKLLEEKSSKFTETNKANIETLLNPLKEDINKFKTKVEETHQEDTKQRVSLEERIKGLVEQTNKVSAEANNLAAALKGKPQKRGNWGEMILERILESSGLTKDREYFIQQSVKDEEGNNLRPDVKVNLPDERVIIIDSKVSLIAYDKFSASEDADEQKIFLAEHIKATQDHIDQLSAKKYDDIETSLDFTMMFIPIEPAYLLAIQGNSDLWTYAYSKRILLVSPTNLIACLKLISDLWKREWQSKNAMDIVKKGEALYEKFVGFTQTFEDIGNSIRSSQEKYDKALGQLKDGRGNLINQAIQLKNLGLKSNKRVPDKLLPLSIDDTDIENTNADE
jgi:DNA recombination protein RmuC